MAIHLQKSSSSRIFENKYIANNHTIILVLWEIKYIKFVSLAPDDPIRLSRHDDQVPHTRQAVLQMCGYCIILRLLTNPY